MATDRRLSAAAIRGRKGTKFPVVTAYDAPFAKFAETAGIDVFIVGDSAGNVVLGHNSTTPVDLVDMQRIGASVARGTKRAHPIVDLPFGSYEVSDEEAVRNAIALVKFGGACSVKLEGGRRAASRIAAIVNAGIPVCAHIGVLPQTAANEMGFKRKSDRETLLADARAVEAAGAFAVVLEMVDAQIAGEVTEAIAIPTIGIGSGGACDAQVLVLHDALGMFESAPPFAKRYADIASVATEALRTYAEEVRDGRFPGTTKGGRSVPGADVEIVPYGGTRAG